MNKILLVFVPMLIMTSIKAQYGTVKSSQKISQTQGNFNVTLDTDDRFGQPEGIGDIDGDGTPDMIISAKNDDDGGTDAGAVYICFMNANGTVKSYQKIGGTTGTFGANLSAGDAFGEGLAGIGDLDNDGVNDIAVGAIGDNDGSSDAGAVYIIFLNSNGTIKNYQKISATAGGFTGGIGNLDRFGNAITGLGDLNGDNVEDIAVGATNDDDGASNAGAAYILFLNTNGTVKSHQKISATSGGFGGTLAADDNFGRVENIGDLDNDGVTDMAVGFASCDDGSTNNGGIYILFMNNNGTVKKEQRVSAGNGGFNASSLSGNAYFGNGIGACGDLNGDNIEDIAVGAWGMDLGGTARGGVFILMMDTNGTVKSQVLIGSGSGGFMGSMADGDAFGNRIGAIGDLNNDGVNDIVVAAILADDGGSNKGAAHVIFLNGASTGVSSVQNEITFDIYPNPAQNYINIKYSSHESSLIAADLFDVNGAKVLSRAVASSAGVISLSVQDLSKGLYVAKVSIGNRYFARRIVVQ